MTSIKILIFIFVISLIIAVTINTIIAFTKKKFTGYELEDIGIVAFIASASLMLIQG